jgi:hypothetical protein
MWVKKFRIVVGAIRLTINWQMPGPFGPNNLAQLGQVQHQHITIEKQKRKQCLILRRCRHLTCNGQMGEEATDLRSPHLA